MPRGFTSITGTINLNSSHLENLKKKIKEKNGDLIVTTINKLSKEGFEITHVGSGLSNNGMITKIFMTRK